MGKGRLEAFSDGVIAIILTIMVLELKIPHEASWEALRPVAPAFASYVLSYVNIGIYWNNHHHLLHAMHHVSGGVQWANLHLLFWLSLIPFTTGWMGENHFAPIPTAVYGAVLLMCGVAYWVLVHRIIVQDGGDSLVARAIGSDVKGKASVVLYAIAIPAAFVERWVSFALIVVVTVMWFIPDQRIVRALSERPAE
jgi:uncharacterized membrane protein